MTKLIYGALTSLDGYVADETGNFDWAEPDEEVHAFVNDLERAIGTYLFGRKMYETMAVWETPDVLPHLTPAMLEFAPIWQAAEKIVYSTTLQTVSTAKKTRIERRFEPDIGRATQGRSDPISHGALVVRPAPLAYSNTCGSSRRPSSRRRYTGISTTNSTGNFRSR